MKEVERREHQQHYFDCAANEGWADKKGRPLWPAEEDARAKAGRGQFALQLIELLDGTFIDWWERLSNPDKRRSDLQLTSGSIGDREEQAWQKDLASMTEQQRLVVLRIIDDVLQRAAYSIGMALDRFDYGELSIHMTATTEDNEPLFTTKIHPHGHFELFQDLLAWRNTFSRINKITAKDGEAGKA